MVQTLSPVILKISLFLMTAVATHLVMSFGQTFLHYKVAHHRIGGKLFRSHINFHHTHYADDHLVSRTYLGDEGNITPYFFIPLFLVGGCAYFLLPLNLFVMMVIASAASFYAHVFFDRQYHVEGSRLQRFAWFRRQQELHFVHHRHANSTASGCDASIAKARKTIANSAGPDIFQPKRFDTAKTHLRHRTRCTKATRAEMAFRVETRGSSPDLRLVVQNDVQQ